jgi:hypothetical protein
LHPETRTNVEVWGSSFPENVELLDISKYLKINVVGIKKGFYICTRLGDKRLKG